MRTWIERFDFNLSRKQLLTIFIIDLAIILLVFLSALRGSIYLFLPLVIGISFVLLLNYKLSVYLLLISLFIRYDIYFMGKFFVPIDLISLILVFSFLGYFLTSRSLIFRGTPLDKPIYLFLVILGLSLVNTVDFSSGIRVYIWHLQVFVIFYLVSWGIDSGEVHRFLNFFLGLASLHTIYSIFQFWHASGKVRAFGLGGPNVADLIIGGLIISYSFYLFEPLPKKRLTYGLIFLLLLGGLFVTQTRGAMISFVLIYLLLSFIALKKAGSVGFLFSKQRVLVSLSLVLLVMAVLFLSYPELLKRVHHGLYYLPGRYVETTEIRLYLWSLAVKSFLHNPVLGIGLGQFYNLSQVFPELRFSPLVFYIYGLDPHNIVLYYLSSAGILGILALFYFFFSVLKIGWAKFKLSLTPQDTSITFALLGIVLFVFISSFYAGEWFYRVSGIEFLFFLGLLNVFKPKAE
ncbi:MAG: O-antigen ligase family protein [candidate division Zixibacteria bacterium]|nr:O-antigen ligase family protein [candidate division Zixibacteria bacterium]